MFIKNMDMQYAENGHFSCRKMDCPYSHLAIGWSKFYSLNSLKLLSVWPRDRRAKSFKAGELGATANRKAKRNEKKTHTNIIHTERIYYTLSVI